MMKLLHDFELMLQGLQVGSLGLELFDGDLFVVRSLTQVDS